MCIIFVGAAARGLEVLVFMENSALNFREYTKLRAVNLNADLIITET